MTKKISYTVLCSLIGATFILSGFTKIFPIEPFEYTFVDIGISSWAIAPFVARMLIGLEFFIGMLFLFNTGLRKFAYPLGALLLIIFSIYLCFVILLVGNNGNCGCFGSAIEFTPLQALLKNGTMLFMLFILYKYHNGWELKLKGKSIHPLLLLFSFCMPFILNPVVLDADEPYSSNPSENYLLALDTLYTGASLHVPPTTLSKNKHILAFMSLTCSHCKIAAKKMGIIHKNNPQLSFYFVFNGNEKDLKPFFEETNTADIEHCMLSGHSFAYLIGNGLPSIYLINNSIVEQELNYFNMNQEKIELWMKQDASSLSIEK